MKGEKEKILVHTCCAVCGTLFLKSLQNEYDPIMFFSNPNIYPKEEYDKRLEAAHELAKANNFSIIEDDYNHSKWLQGTSEYWNEPEGGKRCGVCFDLRLSRASEKARELGIKKVTTTLALSPYKNEEQVNKAGDRATAVHEREFVAPWKNFEKKSFWKENMDRVRESGIYRQKYCGCEFSIKNRNTN